MQASLHPSKQNPLATHEWRRPPLWIGQRRPGPDPHTAARPTARALLAEHRPVVPFSPTRKAV